VVRVGHFDRNDSGHGIGCVSELDLTCGDLLCRIAAAALPFGKQRRLEIARALATRPKLLLLDEPAAGLRAAEVESLNLILLNLRAEQGLTILVIDHVMALVMAVSDKISVLNFGRKIAEGEPDTVRQAPEVIRAYLGEKAAHALGA